MPTRVVVEPGGVLNIENATLSALDQCPKSMWDGIVLKGNADAIQGVGTVGLYQGYMSINNATVEHARTAVVVANTFQMGSLSNVAPALRSGGIVRAVDAKFHNNVYDVSFSPYENYNQNFDVANNRSSFVRTKFETEGQLNDPDLKPVSHATLALVRGVLFSGCTFSNDLAALRAYEFYDHQGWGIHSISSSFRVQAHCNVIGGFGEPCAEVNLVRSQFIGLHRGIRATTMDLSRTFSISKAIFDNVNLGIRMDGIQDPAITECSFAIPGPWPQDNVSTMYGIYSEQCTGYRIESNTFTSTEEELRNGGLVIRNSGGNYNTFYNNTFDGLRLGSVIQGNNASENLNVGLEVKCNDYGITAKNLFDVALTSYDVTLQRTQGGPANPEDDETWSNPAGNRFSPHDETDHPESDWYVTSSNFVEYFHHTASSGNRTKPEYSNSNDINPVDATVFWPEKNVACPSSFGRTKSQLRDASGISHDGWEIAASSYDATKDNGDTYTLFGYVSDESQNSTQVRNALQSVAPNVSTEVWRAAFERSAPMQAWHITQALLSNSPLQGEVLKMVDVYGLPTYYADLVYSGQTGDASLLAKLQSEVARFAAEKADALYDLSQQSWSDSLDLGGSLDSLKLWHQVLPSDNSATTIAGVLSAKRDLAALELLADAEEQSSTAPVLYAVVKRFAAAEQLGGWYSSDADILYLESLAAQREPIGSALAYGWLEALGQEIPEEIILHPEDTPKRSARPNKMVDWTNGPQLEAFPNPSNGPIFVVYDVPEGVRDAVLRILDLSGRELRYQRISTGPGISTLDTDAWANGVYIAELRLDGAALATVRLSVQR